MIDLQPVHIALPRESSAEIEQPYGLFFAHMWLSIRTDGWLASVIYHIGTDIEIHRTTGHAMNEVDAAQWIQAAFDDGPFFILPLLEANHDTP